MLGRQELERLRLQKQALILESHLNRVSLQTEWQELRRASAWLTSPTAAVRKASPWLLIVASVAGFFAMRRLRGRESMLSRVTSLLKWVQPLYGLWTRLRARPQNQGLPEAESP